MSAILDKVKPIIEAAVKETGCSLVDVEYLKEGMEKWRLEFLLVSK